MNRILQILLLACSAASMQAQQNSNNFKYLDINNVKAGIWSKGLSLWDSIQQKPSYEVPAGGGKSSTAGSGIWITGVDNNGTLYASAQTYRQNGAEFFPGFPFSTPAGNSAYNQVWKMTAAEVQNFLTNGTITSNIQNWPGNGNIAQNQDPKLAPYVDMNADQIYDPADGDYPCIKGDEAIFFVISDSVGTNFSGAQRLPIEIRCMAYAFSAQGSHPELSNTIFMQYQVIYRGTTVINNTYLSLWNDVNIGYGSDDYTGCNINGNYSFGYNGDSNDETAAGYGSYPPVQGYVLLNGPFADTGDGIDNDNDGCIDCTYSGTVAVAETPSKPEQCLLNNYAYFNPSAANAAMGSPVMAIDFRNYATSHWKDGSPFTCGGNAYGGSTPVKYAFPDTTYAGNPCNAWSEVIASNTPGDRQSVMSCGPFTLQPGAINYLTCAFVTVFNSSGNSSGALTQLRSYSHDLKAFYDLKYPLFGGFSQCSGNGITGIEEHALNNVCSIFPNPVQDLLNVRLLNDSKEKLQYQVTDVIGKSVMGGENERAGKFTVPVSNLTPGVYFIRLSLNGQSAVKKFIKE